MAQINCATCGDALGYDASTGEELFCSDACWVTGVARVAGSYVDGKLDKTKPYGAKRGTCARCGEVMWRGSTSLPPGQAKCRPCRRVEVGPRKRPVGITPHACARCGVDFVGRRDRKFCSRKCYDDARLPRTRHTEGAGRRRRARKLGAQSEPYTRDSIAERDGYLCGLCRGDVDMDLSYPDPMSPSVDHVIPLSTGGNDTVANVQLAHLRCNLSKGPRALVS